MTQKIANIFDAHATIVIGEGYEAPTCGPNPCVSRGGQPGTRFENIADPRRSLLSPGFDNNGGGVGRSVIDDNNFGVIGDVCAQDACRHRVQAIR